MSEHGPPVKKYRKGTIGEFQSVAQTRLMYGISHKSNVCGIFNFYVVFHFFVSDFVFKQKKAKYVSSFPFN